MKKAVPFAMLFGLFLAHAGLLSAADKELNEKVHQVTNGTYQLVSSTEDGVKKTDDEIKDVYMELKGGTWTVRHEKAVIGKGTFTILSEKDGYRIVSGKVTLGENKGKESKHISKNEGDTLTICHPGEGEELPTEFSSKKGSGRRLSVWKRVKK